MSSHRTAYCGAPEGDLGENSDMTFSAPSVVYFLTFLSPRFRWSSSGTDIRGGRRPFSPELPCFGGEASSAADCERVSREKSPLTEVSDEPGFDPTEAMDGCDLRDVGMAWVAVEVEGVNRPVLEAEMVAEWLWESAVRLPKLDPAE